MAKLITSLVALLALTAPIDTAYAINPHPRLVKRVLGGDIVTPEFRYPFMAALFIDTELNGRLFNCGGVLLNKNWVLTAGQCSFTESAGSGRPGDWARTSVETHRQNLSASITSEEGGRYGVALQLTHPDYFDILGPFPNDIAVWKLKEPAVGTTRVRLNFKRNDTDHFAPPGTDATMIGWGKVKAADVDTSAVLRETNIRILSHKECKRLLPDNEEYGPQYEAKINICGVGHGNKGIANGDAGGPLFVYDQHGIPVIVGIASRTSMAKLDRKSKPVTISIFTRVSKYAHWVNQAITANVTTEINA